MWHVVNNSDFVYLRETAASENFLIPVTCNALRYHMILWHAINYPGAILLPPPHSFEQGERPAIFQANFLLFFLLVAFDFGWSPAITVVGGCFISSFRPPSCGSRSRRVEDKSLRRSDLEDREQRIVRTKTNRATRLREGSRMRGSPLPHKGGSPVDGIRADERHVRGSLREVLQRSKDKDKSENWSLKSRANRVTEKRSR